MSRYRVVLEDRDGTKCEHVTEAPGRKSAIRTARAVVRREAQERGFQQADEWDVAEIWLIDDEGRHIPMVRPMADRPLRAG